MGGDSGGGRRRDTSPNVTFCDSTLNTANLCPAISVVGLFYLFTVMFTSVVDIESYGVDFTRSSGFACVPSCNGW